jgi:uncharacterized membrane protein YhiD involved in acid resistance
VYIKTYEKGQYSQNFALTLVMLPSIIAIIILLVGSNIARAFSLAGAFSIIRFRSEAGSPKEIAYVFFAMAAGLACGVGFFGYAVLFTLVLCMFLIVLGKVGFGVKKSPYKLLKVTIPEDLDYQREFEEVFNQYALSYELQKVKTTDLGSLYELVYLVSLYYDADEKEFIDALRCRNGNLNIVLGMNVER